MELSETRVPHGQAWKEIHNYVGDLENLQGIQWGPILGQKNSWTLFRRIQGKENESDVVSPTFQSY